MTAKKTAAKKTAGRKGTGSQKASLFANLPIPEIVRVLFTGIVHTFGSELALPGTCVYNPNNWRESNAPIRDLLNKLFLDGWQPNLNTATGMEEHPLAYQSVLDEKPGPLVLIQGHRRYRALAAIALAEADSDNTKLERMHKSFKESNPGCEPRRLYDDPTKGTYRDRDVDGILPDGGIEVRVFPCDLSAEQQDLLINDEDDGQVTKTIYERFPAYLRWRMRSKSVLDACRLVGFQSRQMVYTWLEKLPVEVVAAWLGVARLTAGDVIVHPFITDPADPSYDLVPDVRAKLLEAPAYAVANPQRNPDAEAYKGAKESRVRRISESDVRALNSPEAAARKTNPALVPGTSEGFADALQVVLAGNDPDAEGAKFRASKENIAAVTVSLQATGNRLAVRALYLAMGQLPVFNSSGAVTGTTDATNADAKTFKAECVTLAASLKPEPESK